MGKVFKKEIGITLIALLITIIVLLILAGISIATLIGDNGILTQVENAKEATEIAEEKEIIGLSALQVTNNNVDIDETKLQQALNENSKEGNKASIIESDIDTFFVKFESERYYEVNKNGNIEYIENITGEKTLTVQCVNSKDEVLAEYKYTILKDNYSKVSPVVEGYEAKDEKIEGEITEDTIIKLEYYLILQDDTTLVFTGLDASGNVTTNESEIVSYMVGDGSTANNGLTEKGKGIQAVLKMPEYYSGKPIIDIAKSAFQNNTTIKKVEISDNIQKIGESAFHDAYGMIELAIGKNVNTIGNNAFTTCANLKKVKFRCEMQKFGSYFTNTHSWTEIEVGEDNKFYKVVDNVLYSGDGKTLIIVPRGKNNFKIAEGTEVLEDFAFCNCYKITSVEIPDSVSTI